MNMSPKPAAEGSMARKDDKGRNLRSNEFVRKDGRYVFQYDIARRLEILNLKGNE